MPLLMLQLPSGRLKLVKFATPAVDVIEFVPDPLPRTDDVPEVVVFQTLLLPLTVAVLTPTKPPLLLDVVLYTVPVAMLLLMVTVAVLARPTRPPTCELPLTELVARPSVIVKLYADPIRPPTVEADPNTVPVAIDRVTSILRSVPIKPPTELRPVI